MWLHYGCRSIRIRYGKEKEEDAEEQEKESPCHKGLHIADAAEQQPAGLAVPGSKRRYWSGRRAAIPASQRPPIVFVYLCA